MARKRLLYAFLGLIVGIAATLGGLYWAVQHVPEFYADILNEDLAPAERQREAKVLVSQTKKLVEQLEFVDTWTHELTQNQVNSWIIEELPKHHADAIPPGVREPRVRFVDQSVQLGFRIERSGLSGVVTLQVRPTVNRPNEIDFEIDWVNAGLLPVPIKQLVSDAVAKYRSDRWSLAWGTSADGNDKVTLRITPEDTSTKLETIRVVDGVVELGGKGGGKSSGSQPVQLTHVRR
ncbi:MAG: hypothetical protein O3A00_18935 [Planctomycetota bacterium]|nr:hypothetical protein [Planctomycetota bacterium]